MLDFLKKDKEQSPQEIAEEMTEENVKEYNQEDAFDMTALFEQLDYTNTYLAQILMTQRELVKQQTIANALNLLNQQYEHADSFMKVDEIQEKYLALAGEIFVDYMVSEEDLNNLENKD